HDRDHAIFELYEEERESRLQCRPFGKPELVEGCRFDENACSRLQIPPSSFALGLGALGEQFADCKDRFGEFLAVAGAAAYQPADGQNVPDFLMFGPETPASIQACYGLVCTGTLGQLVRFEAKNTAGTVTLTEIVTAALEITRTDCLGMVLACETIGLIG